MDVYVHLQSSFSKQPLFIGKVIRNYRSFSSIHDNYIILGDFNMDPSDSILKTFMQPHNLFNLINQTQVSKEGVLA